MYKVNLLILVFLFFTSLEIKETNAKDNTVTKIIKSVLEKLPEKTTIPEIALETENNKLTNVSVVLENLESQVDGDKSFGFKMNLNLTRILVGGYYDFKHLDIPELFPLFGNGKFWFNLTNVYSLVHLKATYNFDTEKFDIEIPTFEVKAANSKVFIENLMNDPYVSDFLNELIYSLIPSIFGVLQEVVDKLHSEINYFGNEVIRCIKEELITGQLEECLRNIKMPAQFLHSHIFVSLLNSFHKL